MKRTHWATLAVILVSSVSGCGSKPAPDVASNGKSNNTIAVAQENPGSTGADGDTFQTGPVVNTPAKELPVTGDAPPEKVVTEFLNALRTGNDGVTAGLLTEKARLETAKHNLAVQPPGTPTAKYEVGKAELLPDDPNMSQVNCLWTETLDGGKTQTDEIAWLVRKEKGCWRVAGMATRIPGKQDPIFLDFEDPLDMMRVWEEANREVEANLAKSAPPSTNTNTTPGSNSVRQASQPGTPGNSLR